MKLGFTLIAAGLMLFTGAMSIAADAAGPTRVSNLGDIGELAPDRDDMGPDWITYDDGGANGLIAGGEQYAGGYWSKVTFTPVSQFALHAIRMLPLNQAPNNDAHFFARVYSVDGNDLDELLAEFVTEDVPVFARDAYVIFEFEHDEIIEFEADEDFAVLYYSPGGNYDGFQEGDGWWNLYDGANNANRSYWVNAPSDEDENGLPEDPDDRQRNWTRAAGDFIISANGEYLEEFIDLEVLELYAESDLWMITPGTEQFFTADIINNADAAQFPLISFSVLDAEGDVVWTNDIILDDIEEEAEISVSTDEAWIAPDELGNYTVWVFIDLFDDANNDNNQAGLDQIVFNPSLDDGQNDMWLGYVDEELENDTQWNEDSGWATAFYHPGGDMDALRIDGFRVNIMNVDGEDHEVEFAVHMLNLEEGLIEERWVGTADLPAENAAHWVEIDLSDWGNDEEADGNAIFDTEAWMVTYFFQNGTRFPIDGTPPWAGTSGVMPATMLETQNDGNSYNFSGAGDYPIQVRLSESNAPPEGPHLEVTPSPIVFHPDGFDGELLEAGIDYEIQAEFYSFGTDAVEISQIRISNNTALYISIDPSENITIQPEEQLTVTVVFHCSEEDLEDNGSFVFESQMLIQNNTEERNMIWRIEAYVGPVSVNENVRPGLPDQYSLEQNHPNPFNPTTTIDFALPISGAVVFDLFDMNGRLVQEVYNGSLPAGYHSVTIDAADLAAGVYLYRLSSADFVSSHKMVLIK